MNIYPSMLSIINVVVAGAIPTKAAISACYEAFKLEKPDTYDDVLRSWYRVRVIKQGDEISMSKRGRDFRRFVDKIDGLVSCLPSLYCSKFTFCRFGMAPATSALRAYALLRVVS